MLFRSVGSTEEVSIAELAELVRQTVGSNSVVERVPYHEAYAPGFEDMQRRRPVINKLAMAVGFRPATSLARIVDLTASATTNGVR